MAPISEVKKEVYIRSPENRVTPTASISYIGEGLRREEVRTLVRSSDWSDTVRRRRSEDNGRTWSEWEAVYDKAPTQGEYTQSGGPSQGGSGPLYLVRLGEQGGGEDVWTTNCYRYTLTF